MKSEVAEDSRENPVQTHCSRHPLVLGRQGLKMSSLNVIFTDHSTCGC